MIHITFILSKFLINSKIIYENTSTRHFQGYVRMNVQMVHFLSPSYAGISDSQFLFQRQRTISQMYRIVNDLRTAKNDSFHK